MNDTRLLLRWSWRDLRAHWVKVAAIALVIAIGTGTYAGLTATANWRRTSYAASFDVLGMHDLRVELATGSDVPAGSLAAAITGIEHREWIVAAEERLLVPTQVDASTASQTILVPGILVGSDLSDGGPHVNGYFATAGRALEPTDAGTATVLLETKFANHHGLPAAGEISISGDRALAYAGLGLSPEYFVIAPEGQIFFSEAVYAALFTSVETAQSLAGRPGAVNDLVVTLTDDADAATVAAELDAALSSGIAVGFEVTDRSDNTAYTSLTEDVDNDQQVFNVWALLLFVGAIGAAFNLINRLVEEQRREIGISMALGVPPRRIAIRPLLVGAQVALFGVVFGIGVGLLFGKLMEGVMEALIPLPIWETPFQPGLFLGAAAIGFVVPLLAAAWPVWRAVRVQPVQAIQTGHLAVRRSGSINRVRIPGNTFALLPFRNLMRAPRRTIFTILGIAAVMTVLIGFLGVMDSFLSTIDRADLETAGAAPDRVLVDLDTVYPADAPSVRAIAEARTVGPAQQTLRVGASVAAGADEVDLIVEFIDLDDGIWTPTITAGDAADATRGLVLSEKAAADLDVAVGDTVSLEHPAVAGPGTMAFMVTETEVTALHPYPIRTFAYMDDAAAAALGLGGLTNVVQLEPAAGYDDGDVTRELFQLDAVAAVQRADAATAAVRSAMEQILSIIVIIAGFVLVLAVLIAFNSASINLDAKSAREHATMFAYGVHVRTALRMAMVESAVIGIVATTIGLIGGLAMVWWMVNQLLVETIPEIGIALVMQPSTFIIAALTGIVAVAVAPILTVPKMRRMDVPGTLRYME